MHIVLVHIHVLADAIETFRQATILNAHNSILEEGILRFDFLQQSDHPEWFSLIEVYRSADDQKKHRETAHYLAWRDAVAELMAEPRQGIIYQNVFPPDGGWVK
jgi:(4S)-4-hydroxy-5-phosphonooxypentane-2,3-dione isomerase